MVWLLMLVSILCLQAEAGSGQKEQNTNGVLARQVMLQQLYVEEQVRSAGTSGLKRIRLRSQGTRPYHATTHSAQLVAAIHDHSNNIRTVGMGELIVVLNGVEFRTRHNDYRLYMPSRTSNDYHAVEEIPFPEVPPEVTQRSSIEDQIKEMKEWFKAWRDQDASTRNYTKYFKPILCYLEGSWTVSESDELDESFDSDRHQIDADSWLDLQEKIRFTAATGTKNPTENFAYLPTTILNISTDGVPELAQWNYRILCHPLEGDLPLNRFRVIDDLSTRMAFKRTIQEHSESRAARFQLNEFDEDEWLDGFVGYSLTDKLMAEVPGKDNYPGQLQDEAFDNLAYRYMEPDEYNGTDIPLNAAYYHRVYKMKRKGAMGQTTRWRGTTDATLYMAMNSQPKVAPFTAKKCDNRGRKCQVYTQRWSYAIPLEIIYLTPLNKWNPYNIAYKGDKRTDPEAEYVEADGRNGKPGLDKAYNGTHSKLYYITPESFFTGKEVSKDEADTSKNRVVVLDKSGTMRQVRPSGTRIFLPHIEGVGTLRTRFPIMPVHGEGDTVWKEMEALKDILLEPRKYHYMFRENVKTDSSLGEHQIWLRMGASEPDAEGDVHRHYVKLSFEDAKELRSGETISMETTTVSGHMHIVEIRCKDQSCGRIVMDKCDNRNKCSDGHPKWFIYLKVPDVGENDEDEDI